MNILHILSSSNFGGAENYVFLLTKYQNRAGHNIYIYRNKLKKLDFLLQNHVKKDIKTSIINSISPFHIIKLLTLVKKNNIDIIHTHLSKASILGGILSKITNIKSYATIHGMNSFHDYYFNDRLIAVSKAVKKKLIETGGDKNKIKVIYNGIEKNTERIKDKFFKNDFLKLTFIGRLAEEKNLEFLISSLDKWNYKKWDLKIIGTGQREKVLKKIVFEKNLKDKIYFYGFQKNIEKFIMDSDLIVLPSKKEGFGLSIVEGFSYGVPAIGTNVGGIKEIIDNKKNGFLFESNNQDELVDLLNIIIKDKKFDFWSKNAYEKYQNKFDIIDNTKKVLKYYEE